MSTNNSRNELLMIAIIATTLSYILLALELYYTNYKAIIDFEINAIWLDQLFAKPTWSFLGNYFTHFIVAFLTTSILVVHPALEPPKKLPHYVKQVAVGYICFLLIPLIPRYPNWAQVLYMGCNIFLLLFICITLFRIAAFLHKGTTRSMEQNHINADGFAQNQELIETPISINLRYSYVEKGEKKFGYINVISPFRATSIVGLPGSGKSYSILQQMLNQTIQKGFAAVVYDYKDPTLSKSTYNYYCRYIKNIPIGRPIPKFCYISFKNLKKTYRCNPIKNISTSAEAQDVAFMILTSLNPQMATKQGEFFTESAIKFTALNIYALGLLDEGRYQSIPHVLSMLSKKGDLVFSALKILSVFYPDIAAIFTAFQEAYDNNVLAQLQGQLASAQIGLSALSDESVAYTMTEDPFNPDINIDLDINSSTNPKILCLGNDPEKDKICGLAASVYLTRITKRTNKPGGVPMIFAIDELPTVFFKGLDRLIETARSNKIAVALGFQDNPQIKREYGDKIADATISTISNVFCGAVNGVTAKSMSDAFGEKIVEKKNVNIAANGDISNTISEQKEKRITPDAISELSQGEFVGRVVDSYEDKIQHKVFHGSILVDEIYTQEPETIPDLIEISDEELEVKLMTNLIAINSQVITLLKKSTAAKDAFEIVKNVTLIETAGINYSLEKFIQEGDTNSLAVWAEACLSFIEQIKLLNIKRFLLADIKLRVRQVLENVWEKDDSVDIVLQALENNDFFNIHTVTQITYTLSD